VLKWGGKGAAFGLKFEHQGPTVTDSWYECSSCHSRIDEGHKPEMLSAGEWIPNNPENRNRRGYHLSSLYSPLGWKSWREIAQEFLAAGKNKALLQVWTNTLLAETWEDEGTQPDWVAIKNRAEPYSILEVPRGGLLLTAGVDVQDNRLSLAVWAWGRGEEAWLVYWGEIYEDPGGPQAWVNLDEILNRPYRHAHGSDLSILSAGVDSGGHHTQTVYNYCRTRRPRVFALKGHSRKSTPIISRPTLQDVTAGGQTIKGGVQLWLVGADTAKAQLYSRLQISENGPGKIHTPIGTDDDFYRQLTSEKLVTRFHKGFPVTEWVLESGARNEGLDCTCYALAAAMRIGLQRMDWDELEKAVTPESNDEWQERQQRRESARQGPSPLRGRNLNPSFKR